MSTGGSHRAPRARPKVRLVLFPGLFAAASPSLLILITAARPAAVGAVACARGTDESHPGGAGRRTHDLGARGADTRPGLGVHHAEAADRAGVGRTPGREVVLLGRDRRVMLRLLGPGHDGVRARGNLPAPDDDRDAGQPATAPDPREPAGTRRPRRLRPRPCGAGDLPWHVRRPASRNPHRLASPLHLLAPHDVLPRHMSRSPDPPAPVPSSAPPPP